MLRTAVGLIGIASAVVSAVAEQSFWDTAKCVQTALFTFSAPCTYKHSSVAHGSAFQDTNQRNPTTC